MSWLWVAAGFALVTLFLVWPALVAGRRDDEAHGRLEEQQP